MVLGEGFWQVAWLQNCFGVALVVGALSAHQEVLAIDVVASNAISGKTPLQLSTQIVDGGTGLTVSAVSTDVIGLAGSVIANTSPRSLGDFSNGVTAAGTPLPLINQPVVGGAVYAGGIGISSGVCLCTGVVTDNDPFAEAPSPGRGIGVEGPNDGSGPLGDHVGEIGQGPLGGPLIDNDFNRAVFGGSVDTDSGDPVVLEMTVQLASPGYLQTSFVFGSDEFPAFIQDEFNDSFAVLIKRSAQPRTAFENVVTLKSPGMAPKAFSLQGVFACGDFLFRKNQLAPNLRTDDEFESPHAIDDSPGGEPIEYDPSIPFYDHEFGGFTKLMTRETSGALAPGLYTIKVVIHDVGDARVDAALFLPTNSIRLFTMANGDYNLDGSVDAADYTVFRDNYNQHQGDATFADGDGDGNGYVDFYDCFA